MNQPLRIRQAAHRGFVLAEVLIAVGIFAVGIIGLGYCVENCLRAETLRGEDQRARLVLANRMAEVEARAVNFLRPLTTELKGQYDGMTLKQKSTLLKLQNEKKEPVEGVYQIDLEVTWQSGGEEASKSLQFYMTDLSRNAPQQP